MIVQVQAKVTDITTREYTLDNGKKGTSTKLEVLCISQGKYSMHQFKVKETQKDLPQFEINEDYQFLVEIKESKYGFDFTVIEATN